MSSKQLPLRKIRILCPLAGLLAWPAWVWPQIVEATLPVGGDAVAINRATNKIYLLSSMGYLTVVDGATHATATLALLKSGPPAVAVNESTNKICVATGDWSYWGKHFAGGGVAVLDGGTNAATVIINAPQDWHAAAISLAVNPSTNKIYVGRNGSGGVTVVDGATNTAATVTDPNAPGLAAVAIGVNSTTNRIYVANNGSPGNVTVIDGDTDATTTVTDPNAVGPVNIAVNPVTNKIYVANRGNGGANKGNVTVIDGATNATTTITDPNAVAPGGFDGPASPGIVVDSGTNKVYVINQGSANVTAIDGATNSTTTVTQPAVEFPFAVAVNDVTHTVYVANNDNAGGTGGGSITVINGETNTAGFIIGGAPAAIAVNPVTNEIYAANGDSTTIIDAAGTATTHTLGVIVVGNGGMVTSTPAAGDFCQVSCDERFPAGTAVSLTATTNAGSEFSGWSGPCTGTGSCEVTMDADHFVTATFITQVTVPDVVGQSKTAAATAISAAGLVVGLMSERSSMISSGDVIGENPAAGTTVTPGSAVNLVISTGDTSGSVNGGGGGIDGLTVGGLLLGTLIVAVRRARTRCHLSESQTRAIVVALASMTLLTGPVSLLAADAQAPVHYRVQSLPNKGGLYNATSINDKGWVAGLVEPPGDALDHAALWRKGRLTDLGTLGGPNSSVAFPMKNEVGRLVGQSETAQIDPYLESFCGFHCSGSACAPVNHICKGFLWQGETGKMIALPPLPAGLNSIGYGANNNNEMVGASENGVQDASCQAPQVFDFEGVVWSLDSSGAPFIAKQLRPLAGDAVSAALQINQAGVAVGGSGVCGPPGPAISLHPVKWSTDGDPTDLGSLGGETNNLPVAINDVGQIVGISDLPGDQITHSVLWQHGQIQDLGVLRPGDTFSFASAINNRGEVVGESCGAIDCAAYHWHKGVMVDLNAVLVGAPPGLYVISANDINDRGEIAAAALDPTFGDQVGVVLVPVEDRD